MSEARGESDDSESESEEEGYDSDVQRESHIDYSSKIYCNPIRETDGVKPHLQPAKEETERFAMFSVHYLKLCLSISKGDV